MSNRLIYARRNPYAPFDLKEMAEQMRDLTDEQKQWIKEAADKIRSARRRDNVTSAIFLGAIWFVAAVMIAAALWG